VARALADLAHEGLLLFDDPAREIDQLAMSERISLASEFRLTSAGLDRVRGNPPAAPTILQIVNATNAQVAAGDINNYASFIELLDRAEGELDRLDGIDAATGGGPRNFRETTLGLRHGRDRHGNERGWCARRCPAAATARATVEQHLARKLRRNSSLRA